MKASIMAILGIVGVFFGLFLLSWAGNVSVDFKSLFGVGFLIVGIFAIAIGMVGLIAK